MFSFFKKPSVVIRHRPEHIISRKNIAPEALKVLYRLSHAGYKAYLVGGGVRDLLLGRTPKDFDVGTDASPREIKRLFHRCFLVGRRFRLAHVVFGQTVIETSTFRKQPPHAENDDGDDDLYQASDNSFGTPEEDAHRRDFTVNGLFYDIKTFDVIDYVGGLKDLDKRLLRSIGDPEIRFCEDPVRMMRAIRLSTKLGLTIERKTFKAIGHNYAEIEKASVPRVLEEIFRLFAFSTSSQCFRLMWETKLLSKLMPDLNTFIDENGGKHCLVWKCLDEFDERTKDIEDPSNGLRIAALFLAPYLAAYDKAKAKGKRVNRLDLAQRVVGNFSCRYKMPKSAFFHCAHLLDELTLLAKAPPKSRTIHASRAEQFKDAVLLARIAAAVTGGPTNTIDAWAKLRILAPKRPENDSDSADTPPVLNAGDVPDGPHRSRRRRPRHRRTNRSFDSIDAKREAESSNAPKDKPETESAKPRKEKPESELTKASENKSESKPSKAPETKPEA